MHRCVIWNANWRRERTAERLVPKLVPSEHEDGTESAELAADRLTVIADLLADLPEAERRPVIADLPPADRAAIARLLIARDRKGDTE